MASTSLSNIRGFIPAAGLGTRLRPLTHYRPKPCLEFHGIQVLHVSLSRLSALGIETAVNGHHLAEQVFASARDWATTRSIDKQNVFLSDEQSELLGSGGCYPPLDVWRCGADLLVHNSDVLSDIDLERLIEFHFLKGNDVTFSVLAPEHPAAVLGGTIVCNASGVVVELKERATRNGHLGTGVFLLSASFLDRLPRGRHCFELKPHINDLLREGGKVGVLEHHGEWIDLGSNLEEYVTSQLVALPRSPLISHDGLYSLDTTRNVLSLSCDSVPNQQLSYTIVGVGCSIGRDVYLERCIMLAGSSATESGHYRDGIFVGSQFISVRP